MKTSTLLMTILSLLCLATFAFLLRMGLSLDPNRQESHLVGKEALGFSVPLLQGKELLPRQTQAEQVSLADFKGTPLILNFWASWCESCKGEAQEFETFWEKYKETGVKLLAIAIQDEKDQVEAYVKALHKSFLIGFDEEGRSSIDYGVTGVPETFFIDRNGVVVHREVGPVNLGLLEMYAQKLLEPATGPAPSDSKSL